MEQLVVDFIKGFDVQTLIGVGALLWILINPVKKEMKSLADKVEDIDRRLCRIEGALTAKDCCMLKDEKQVKKAE